MNEQTRPTGPAQQRPRQVTLGGWIVLLGSLFVVVMAYQQVASLGTLDAQEEAARIVREPAVSGLGLSVDDVRSVLRAGAWVAAAAAAASAILGLMVLRRRDRTDRLVLTVLAPVLLIAGLSSAGMLAIIVVLGVMYLWSAPARAWFDGRLLPPTVGAGPAAQRPMAPPAPQPPAPTGQAPAHPPAHPPASPPAEGGRPPGYPPMPPAQHAAPAPAQRPQSWAGQRLPPVPGGTGAAGRPGTVVAACVVTWVACGLAIAVALMALLVLSVAPGEFFRELHDQDPTLADQGISDDAMRAAGLVGSAITLLWAGLASVFAVLVFRRVRWAAIALLACSSLTGLLCAVAMFGSAAAVVPLACGVATTWLLSKDASRAWLGRRGPLSASGPPR